MQLPLSLITTLVSIGITLVPTFAVAQASQAVVVAIRAIKGESGVDTKSTASESDALSDIREKLKKLKYDQLTLISSQQKIVGLNEKESVSIGEGHTLYFRPVYKSDKKACLWLKWTDSTGMNVLDTRLHFNNGETVLTGTSNNDGTGIVLAIDLK
jgi:hypothetical protein